MNGTNWSGYGLWVHENDYKSLSNFDYGYNDSNVIVSEMRAILLGIEWAATKNYWWGYGKYLRIEIRTDSDACIELICGRKTTKNEQCKFHHHIICII